MTANIVTAWVVDNSSTTLLFDEKACQLAKIDLATSLLDSLKPHQVVRLNPSAFGQMDLDKVPDVAVDFFALASLGLLKQKEQKTDGIDGTDFEEYAFNGQLFKKVSFRYITQAYPALSELASHAVQVMRWRDENRHCPKCQTPIYIHESEYAACCPSCHHRSYPRVQPCVIVAITRTNPATHTPEILLALHHRHKDGMYGLVAGFMEIGESVESAIAREVAEEVGLVVRDCKYLASQAWPYPSNLMLGFVATYQSGTIKVQDSELAHADFFDFDNLPKIPNKGTVARDLIEYAAHLYGKSIVQQA